LAGGLFYSQKEIRPPELRVEIERRVLSWKTWSVPIMGIKKDADLEIN
jgi:hypothetical protein